jgi:hypothetical protein
MLGFLDRLPTISWVITPLVPFSRPRKRLPSPGERVDCFPEDPDLPVQMRSRHGTGRASQPKLDTGGNLLPRLNVSAAQVVVAAVDPAR